MSLLSRLSGPLEALADAGDAAGLLAALNTKDIATTYQGRKMGSDVMLALIAAGHDPNVVLETIDNSSNRLLKGFVATMYGQGVDFSTDANQAVIDQYPDAAVRATLLKLGRDTVSIAQQELGRDATEQDVADVLSEWRKMRLEQYLAERANAAAAAISEGTATTEAEVNAAFVGP